jgi:hypothetical protein
LGSFISKESSQEEITIYSRKEFKVMKKIYFLSILIAGLCLIQSPVLLFGQQKEAVVQGTILDKSLNLGIKSASLMLINGKDTSYTISGYYGLFKFPAIKTGTVTLKATCIGFVPFEKSFETIPGDNSLIIKMTEEKEELRGAKVTAEASLMQKKGDTLIFNTAAVRTLSGDDAIEILKQLPGMRIENGKIYMNNEKISRTYVNGTLVFGDNPLSAFNTISADNVTNIKVYDEQTDLAKKRGLKNSNKNKVMDILTKNKIISAWDTRVLASAGADQKKEEDGKPQLRYGTGITSNFYSEMFLFYVNACTNNIDRTSNNISTITNASGGLNDYDESSAVQTGIKKYWNGRKLGNSLDVKYSFNKNYKKSGSHSSAQYFATDDNPLMSYTDTSASSSNGSSHYLSIMLNLQHSPLKSILWTNEISISKLTDRNRKYERIDTSGNNISSISDAFTKSRGKDWKLYEQLNWSDNETFNGFFPELNLSVTTGNSTDVSAILDTLKSSYNRRYITTDFTGKQIDAHGSLSFNYILKNTDRYTEEIDFAYGTGYSSEKKLQTAIDLLGNNRNTVTANTFDYTYSYFNQYISGESIFQNRDLLISTRIELGNNRPKDTERIPEDIPEYSKSFTSILPQLTLRYKNRLTIHYKTETALPSMEQLRDRVDDTNPLFLRIGNPSLKQSYTNNLNISYNTIPQKNGFAFLSHLSLIYVSNDIVRKSEYFNDSGVIDDQTGGYTVQKGATLYSYENVSGTFATESYAGVCGRINKIKGSYRVTAALDFSKKPQYNGEKLNRITKMAPGVKVTIGGTLDKHIKFYIYSMTSYNHNKNSYGTVLSDAITEDLTLSGSFRFLKYGFSDIRYDYGMYRFFSNYGMNTKTQNLNVVIGCTLMKKRMTLSLSGHDLLNKGSLYKMLVSNNSISQTWTPSYGRYFMFNLSFRLNKEKSPVSFQRGLNNGDMENPI